MISIFVAGPRYFPWKHFLDAVQNFKFWEFVNVWGNSEANFLLTILNSFVQYSMLYFPFSSINVMHDFSACLIYLSYLYNEKHNNIFKYAYRIKKLIDMEVLGLSRLQIIVLDMHTDVKGYSLLSLPQIRYDDSCPTYSYLV